MEKKYELLRDNQSPLNEIKKGTIKTREEWIKKFPDLSYVELSKINDWFKEVEEELTYSKIQDKLICKNIKIKAFEVYQNVAEYLNEGWEVDFDNNSQNKYSLYFNSDIDEYYSNENRILSESVIYFKSKKLAEKCIELSKQFKEELGFNFLDVLYK